MTNYKQEIEKLEKLINLEAVNRHNKIENANYILAMQIQAIRKGELSDIESIVKWDFEMLRCGKMVGEIELKNASKQNKNASSLANDNTNE